MTLSRTPAAQAGEPESLAARLQPVPRVADAERARVRLEDLVATFDSDAGRRELIGNEKVCALLLAIADHSAFVWRLITGDPARLYHLFRTAPEARLDEVLSELAENCERISDQPSLMRMLRQARQEVALVIALADLGGIWPLDQVTGALSRAADIFVRCALRFLLREARARGRLLCEEARVESHCGLVVLALGKLGATELNYSSDVDLVVFYDADCRWLAEGVAPGPLYVRLTQALARLLSDRTSDGYVLRVDLRLRPDPGSTAVAISTQSALNYYEVVGQNWERAALIKARPIAGDIALGESLLGELSAFIWRKYFDYAAIADIHAMKRQIHAVRGHGQVTVPGHDLKLGRGGIREIEFFVQTQQLIFGGRRPSLRGRRTLDMLFELQAEGWITRQAVEDLSAAYIQLRSFEHRLQMIADEQTQRLPSDEEDLKRFARFCGYSGYATFEADLTKTLLRVEDHYSKLFEHAAGLDTDTGSLVFTGVADDPETLETLRALGFRKPEVAAETIRGWHFGRRPAVQSPRAREVLTELVPALLDSLSGSGDPDAALAAFDQALARMPAAVELFSILRANKAVRDLFGDVLGSAPRLASILAQRPHLLDAAIDPQFLQAAIDIAPYEMRAQRVLEAATFEIFLDQARIFAQEEGFLIGIRVLSGVLDPLDAGGAYSALAEAVVGVTLSRVEKEFQKEHGAIPQGRACVIAMGKLGSREMTAASDLDLILLYDFDPERPQSDGARPLHASVYYTRLTQRLISALTSATRQGRLYDVDLRLRPSGRSGPVATQLRSFVEYQMNEAETWEHMALTRARPIGGDATLRDDARAAIGTTLRVPRDPRRTAGEAAEMRVLIEKEKGAGSKFDLKLMPGGIIDIEFIAQYLTLIHAHSCPDFLQTETAAKFVAALRGRYVLPAEGETLTHAYALYARFTQMQRLTLGSDADPRMAAEGVKRRLAEALDVPDFQRVEAQIAETAAHVRAFFQKLLSQNQP
ncbi:MAG TPA: bifunctional [glutamine synthetase] adenylyltransferase/[glutamine synthetase]-adenylyl-L-tyrosine phosphorylase [Beijerinckiaceae bacterium]|nr:bifunctional [glutamine synthetase] adenylyltransferase/[glutamine synthetase]-adenylyl-L-tyrosine phosphorylase [Beijerinckiaceae bacterium]